jgi:hypothetical protein
MIWNNRDEIAEDAVALAQEAIQNLEVAQARANSLSDLSAQSAKLDERLAILQLIVEAHGRPENILARGPLEALFRTIKARQ